MTSLAILLAAITHGWGCMFLPIAATGISVVSCGSVMGKDLELKISLLGFITPFLNVGGIVLTICVS